MSEYRASITWQRTTPDFAYESYSRDHEWRFDGVTVSASAAPDYRGNPTRVNPEAGLVAALSSCHMLTFLAIAARKGLTVDSYFDEASGHMAKNEQGRLAVTEVTLRPRVTFAPGVEVSRETLDKMHHQAHLGCFIANSVRTAVTVEPQDA
jgi:organic hydroperoxide reductase OsmC/OhrA